MSFGPLEIDTLFLDAGGVLCYPSWPRLSAALSAHGIDVPAAALAAAEPAARRELDRPRVIVSTNDQSRGDLYFDAVLRHAGIAPSGATRAALAVAQAYHQAHNLWEVVPDTVPAALERLKSIGLTLVVVSNANGRLRHLFDRVGLSRHFDVVLDSHEWGVEKPDPRLFQLALGQAGALASRTAHVGDFLHIDVMGARAAGLKEGILLDSGWLYHDADCRRLRALDELPGLIRLAR